MDNPLSYENVKSFSENLKESIISAIKKESDRLFEEELKRCKDALDKKLRLHYLNCSLNLSEYIHMKDNTRELIVEIRLPKSGVGNNE